VHVKCVSVCGIVVVLCDNAFCRYLVGLISDVSLKRFGPTVALVFIDLYCGVFGVSSLAPLG